MHWNYSGISSNMRFLRFTIFWKAHAQPSENYKLKNEFFKSLSMCVSEIKKSLPEVKLQFLISYVLHLIYILNLCFLKDKRFYFSKF